MLIRKIGNFFLVCIEGILQLFTNFYLQRKFSIFLQNAIQSKKEIHSNRKFGSHCFCKIKKPNKNFLKLKCDSWCSYFDTTDGYLRFISTNGQTTVPFFSGRNLIDEGTRKKNIANTSTTIRKILVCKIIC